MVATTHLDALVDLLRGSAILGHLPDSELRELAGRVHRSRYAKGEFIFRKGDEGSGLMVVVSGRVNITSVGISGDEVLLNITDPGQVFGEIALLDGEPRSADAVAASPTETLTVLRRDFLPILRGHPDAALRVMGVLTQRIRQVTSFVEDALFLDVPTRLLHRLQALANQYGEIDAKTGAVRIEHGLSQQSLGDSVGLTRVSINRQLSAWREQGLIEDGRGWITLLDPEKLDELVTG
jgi:CRP/FNR family cyclic AMP-dependent transcriptional regulator